MMTHEDLIEEVELANEIEVGSDSSLTVYNDDFNTFDWVIESFIEICSHSYAQAEQLSLLIHYKGRATVKTAPFRVIKPMKDALVDRGLSAVIEA